MINRQRMYSLLYQPIQGYVYVLKRGGPLLFLCCCE